MQKTALSTMVLVLLFAVTLRAQQMADPHFDVSIKNPAYTSAHPTVVIDEAHSNFHTAEGRYKPFADLLKSDGYNVQRGKKRFEKGSLDGVTVLVISNAVAVDSDHDVSKPAFTEQECDFVRDWVRAGGALLLIADHAPFGSAAENLGKRFGIGMGKGYTFDIKNSDGSPSTLLFSRENGLLGDHPLLKGRNPSEEVKRVLTFTGQSLTVPEGAVALLKLSPTAYESPNRKSLELAIKTVDPKTGAPKPGEGDTHATHVGGRAQGIAMTFGKGRLVVLGEAAMFSAQVVRFTEGGEQKEFKMGMNVAGNDDRQFAINVMRWLSGLLK